MSNISSTLCFPIRRALLRLVPAFKRERQLRSSAFTNQTDNLSLRCFSRKSKNFSISSQTGAFIVTSWWEVIAGVPSNPTILPADAQLCLWNTAPALEYFLSNISGTVCFPIRRALLRLVPSRALPALQRERQLRSSAFTNQTDNLSLRCFSRKSKNYSFSSQTGALIVTSWWEVIWVCFQILLYCPQMPNCAFGTLHQHLSTCCQIFQAQYASPSAEHC